MSLDQAWTILGRDPRRVMATLRGVQGIEARVAATEKALQRAQKIARNLLAQSHPDRNPGDESATVRFVQTQEALDTIKYYTEELKKKALEAQEAGPRFPDGFIMIKKI